MLTSADSFPNGAHAESISTCLSTRVVLVPLDNTRWVKFDEV